MDSILSNKFLRLIVPGIIVIMFWYFFGHKISSAGDTINDIRCADEQNAKVLELKGLLVSKIELQNQRSSRTITYTANNDTLTSEILLHEANNYFDYLRVGDSLLKQKGSLALIVKRNQSDSTCVLYYGCEK